MRRRFAIPLALMLLAAAVYGWGLSNARADPIVRRAAIGLKGWPPGAPPLHVLLLSDVHLGNAAMDTERLARIVGQANALSPDLMLLAGDFVAGYDPDKARRSAEKLVVPLSKLHAPLGVVATLGNHDDATDPTAVAAALRKAGITVLINQAAVRGPLAIGGIDDSETGNARVHITANAMRGLAGARLMMSHTPYVAGSMPPDIDLLLAGHTHCGQIVLPVIGPLSMLLRGRPFCGLGTWRNRHYLVTAGVGTSIAPLRFGAPPDVWLITFGPAARPISRSRF